MPGGSVADEVAELLSQGVKNMAVQGLVLPPAATLGDMAVAQAKSIPDLIAKAKVLDPGLAAALTPKALIASKSPAGTLLAGGLAFVAGRYGLGWDEVTCDMLAGLAVLLGGYVMRYVTKSPIGGVVSVTTPPATP